MIINEVLQSFPKALTLLGSAGEEPPEQQGQQSSGGAPPASGAPHSSSSQSAQISHPSQRQRRGKRG